MPASHHVTAGDRRGAPNGSDTGLIAELVTPTILSDRGRFVETCGQPFWRGRETCAER